MKWISFLIVLICSISFANAAIDGNETYATYDSDGYSGWPEIGVWGGEMNISEMHQYMYLKDTSEWDTAETVLRQDSAYEYTFLKPLTKIFRGRLDGSWGVINASDVTVNFGAMNGSFGSTDFIMQNATYIGNPSIYPGTYNVKMVADIENVTFIGMRNLNIINTTNPFNISGLNMTNCFDGLSIDFTTSGDEIGNSVFENIVLYGNGNMSGQPWPGGNLNNFGGQTFYIKGQNNNNLTIRDVTITRTFEFNDTPEGSSEGGTGFAVDGGHDIIIQNVSLYGASRSGFGLTGYVNRVDVDNIYSKHALHNGVDLHSQYYVWLNNITVEEAEDEAYMITASVNAIPGIFDDSSVNDNANTSTASHNIYAYDVNIYNTSASAFSLNVFHSILFENVLIENCGSIGIINRGKNLTFINLTASNLTGTYEVTLGASDVGNYGFIEDTKFIDSEMAEKTMYMVWQYNTSLINTNHSGFAGFGAKHNDFDVQYYPNILVTDMSDNPLQNAIITVENTVESYDANNGYGNIQETFITDSNGQLYDNGNRSNWLAITDYQRVNNTITNHEWNITATLNGYTNTTEDVNMSIIDYSSDVSSLNGSVIKIMLQSETSGLYGGNGVICTIRSDGQVTYSQNIAGNPTAYQRSNLRVVQ